LSNSATTGSKSPCGQSFRSAGVEAGPTVHVTHVSCSEIPVPDLCFAVDPTFAIINSMPDFKTLCKDKNRTEARLNVLYMSFGKE
jgi:hypothetical protein